MKVIFRFNAFLIDRQEKKSIKVQDKKGSVVQDKKGSEFEKEVVSEEEKLRGIFDSMDPNEWLSPSVYGQVQIRLEFSSPGGVHQRASIAGRVGRRERERGDVV
ncbi:hypothetical protein SUGI_0933270 [Cryptomeria japonica]|nr:hypothetical protein SUGI_0933270 [Cryptomeria japonica]